MRDICRTEYRWQMNLSKRCPSGFAVVGGVSHLHFAVVSLVSTVPAELECYY